MDSVYAYAPRYFAHEGRLQLQEIMNDLLNRQIIRTSTFPYCARVVPVKKKNGALVVRQSASAERSSN